MTKSHLVPCAGCSRHVRVSEEACPFCRARLPASLRQAARPLPPTARLTRAALFAFGTGTMAVAPSACSSSSSSGDVMFEPPYGLGPIPDAGEDDATVSALYGAPADDGGDHPGISDAADGAPADEGGEHLSFADAYGAPAYEPDSGPVDASTTDASDGSAEPVADAAYGGPPVGDATAADDSGHNATPAYGIPAH
jgi:hypothetical protein